MKRITTALVLGLGLVLWAPAVQAAQGWFIAEIIAAGPADNGRVYMKLNDSAEFPAFNNKWFQVSDSVKKEMLATLLAAFIAGRRIWIRTDPDASFGIVTIMYIRD